ncbi:hypothetical protein BT69DRAFT_1353626 [Atractiella rhizophila]|nr:hypothetical protein BT69DRAFT_1353626 [Atractiella rhizophila]
MHAQPSFPALRWSSRTAPSPTPPPTCPSSNLKADLLIRHAERHDRREREAQAVTAQFANIPRINASIPPSSASIMPGAIPPQPASMDPRRLPLQAPLAPGRPPNDPLKRIGYTGVQAPTLSLFWFPLVYIWHSLLVSRYNGRTEENNCWFSFRNRNIGGAVDPVAALGLEKGVGQVEEPDTPASVKVGSGSSPYAIDLVSDHVREVRNPRHIIIPLPSTFDPLLVAASLPLYQAKGSRLATPDASFSVITTLTSTDAINGADRKVTATSTAPRQLKGSIRSSLRRLITIPSFRNNGTSNCRSLAKGKGINTSAS